MLKPCRPAGSFSSCFRPLGASILALAALSCSSAPDPGWTWPLQDQRGRQCEYQCSVDDCVLLCDQPEADAGLACATGMNACLTVTSASDPRITGVSIADPAADLLCAGCCDRSGVVGGLSDCAPVACASDNDCYADGYSCRSGYCACTDATRCLTGPLDAGTGGGNGSADAADAATADEAAQDAADAGIPDAANADEPGGD